MAVAGIHRFTVDDFARMGEAGIFTEDDRVELIGGEVRDMAPTSPPHAWAVSRLGELLITRLAGRVHVRVQNPIRLGPHTEPQPDLAVARRTRAYVNRHPDAADVLLVIEVADSSLPFDRSEKAPRYYGRVGIAETWLVDLAARTVRRLAKITWRLLEIGAILESREKCSHTGDTGEVRRAGCIAQREDTTALGCGGGTGWRSVPSWTPTITRRASR